MQFRKYRWSPTYEPSELELVRLLESRNIDAKPWSAEEYEEFPARKLDYDKRLWCAEGSMSIVVGGIRHNFQAGDAMEIPAGTVHEATAGFTGCTCYESPPQQSSPAKL